VYIGRRSLGHFIPPRILHLRVAHNADHVLEGCFAGGGYFLLLGNGFLIPRTFLTPTSFSSYSHLFLLYFKFG
jgi:hypothetical protein